MIQKIPSKVPRKRRLFPDRPLLSAAEIASRKAELEKFYQQCQVIFNRIYPELGTCKLIMYRFKASTSSARTVVLNLLRKSLSFRALWLVYHDRANQWRLFY